MISYIKLKNFKSFEKVTLDLHGKNGIPKKLAFIYGENGSGKTNLMESMYFLRSTFDTLKNINDISNFNTGKLQEKINENPELKNELFEKLFKQAFRPLNELLKDNKMINSKDTMQIEIGFYLNDKEGVYLVEFDDSKVIKETLFYTIKKRIGEIFSISCDEIKLNDSVFLEKKYKNEIEDNINKFWGKHTFMSILFNETSQKNQKYINQRINKNLLDCMKFFSSSTVICNNNFGHKGFSAAASSILSNLESGIINDDNKNELPVFEKFLNIFFTQLYSDIKKVYYKTALTTDSTEKYELFVMKEVYNKIIEIPFRLESTGTQKLLNILPAIVSSLSGSSVLIDEVDSGIHDQLMFKIIELFKSSLLETKLGQFIATTHNTLLMKQLAPENIYIINSDAFGNKEIKNVGDYYFRTHKNNNPQLKYLNGDYSGIPNIGYLDFKELVEDINDSFNKDENLNNE